ncbi:hypothetical protein [Rhizohabitans arisaemae]|uniref:hypothetical protein n=1 Tax=Rhizohabitans arisaemae TaxID=2720610 RepID=UPI0024B11764|nr:hypothetical protein [Rhizohabitans arisaemae]
MTLRPRNVLFQTIETRVVEQHPGLLVDTSSGLIRLTPQEAKASIRGNRPYEAVWRAAILAARHGEPDQELSFLFAVWLAEPWMTRVMSMISSRFRESREDLEAEFVTAFLENLHNIDLNRLDASESLLIAASRSTWALACAARRERPVNDSCDLMARDDLESYAESGWELEFIPPPRPDRLSAPLRFVADSTRIEGERLGTLAYRLGLADIVLRARRPLDDAATGHISLRAIGARR